MLRHGGEGGFVEDVFEVLELEGGRELDDGTEVGVRGGRTVRAYWRMSTSVMACLSSRTGAARARDESSIGAAVVESFMLEKWVESGRWGCRDNRGRLEQKSADIINSFHARHYIPQVSLPPSLPFLQSIIQPLHGSTPSSWKPPVLPLLHDAVPSEDDLSRILLRQPALSKSFP